jgi:hypothetical protein
MKLDFIVPGFSKCGTTTLCSLLGDHPDIFITKGELKEPSFFTHHFAQGWSWYETYFRMAKREQVVGEGSTLYSTAEFAELACQRIAQYFPEIRLIFIARNPITRLESSYRELHHNGYEWYRIETPYSIGQAMEELPNMIEDTRYWQRISTFRRYFPDSRILVLFLEDFVQEPARELARCFEFLGVDPSVCMNDLERRLNPGSNKFYDSRILRFIRSHRWSNRWWTNLSAKSRDRLMRAWTLRKPFTGPVRWKRETRRWVVAELAEDARQFLTFYGKPAGYWDFESPGSSTDNAARAAA